MNATMMIAVPLALFVGYRVVRRVRRTFVWQTWSVRKLRFSLAILSIVGLIFFLEGARQPVSLLSNALGLALGAALAYWGAAMTRFEQRDGEPMYRPNPWIGGAITALFLGRLGCRMYVMLQPEVFADGFSFRAASPFQSMGGSWTSGLMLVMFAYYITYYAILLRRVKGYVSERPPGERSRLTDIEDL